MAISEINSESDTADKKAQALAKARAHLQAATQTSQEAGAESSTTAKPSSAMPEIASESPHQRRRSGGRGKNKSAATPTGENGEKPATTLAPEIPTVIPNEGPVASESGHLIPNSAFVNEVSARESATDVAIEDTPEASNVPGTVAPAAPEAPAELTSPDLQTVWQNPDLAPDLEREELAALEALSARGASPIQTEAQVEAAPLTPEPVVGEAPASDSEEVVSPSPTEAADGSTTKAKKPRRSRKKGEDTTPSTDAPAPTVETPQEAPDLSSLSNTERATLALASAVDGSAGQADLATTTPTETPDREQYLRTRIADLQASARQVSSQSGSTAGITTEINQMRQELKALENARKQAAKSGQKGFFGKAMDQAGGLLGKVGLRPTGTPPTQAAQAAAENPADVPALEDQPAPQPAPGEGIIITDNTAGEAVAGEGSAATGEAEAATPEGGVAVEVAPKEPLVEIIDEPEVVADLGQQPAPTTEEERAALRRQVEEELARQQQVRADIERQTRESLDAATNLQPETTEAAADVLEPAVVEVVEQVTGQPVTPEQRRGLRGRLGQVLNIRIPLVRSTVRDYLTNAITGAAVGMGVRTAANLAGMTAGMGTAAAIGGVAGMIREGLKMRGDEVRKQRITELRSSSQERNAFKREIAIRWQSGDIQRLARAGVIGGAGAVVGYEVAGWAADNMPGLLERAKEMVSGIKLPEIKLPEITLPKFTDPLDGLNIPGVTAPSVPQAPKPETGGAKPGGAGQPGAPEPGGTGGPSGEGTTPPEIQQKLQDAIDAQHTAERAAQEATDKANDLQRQLDQLKQQVQDLKSGATPQPIPSGTLPAPDVSAALAAAQTQVNEAFTSLGTGISGDTYTLKPGDSVVGVTEKLGKSLGLNNGQIYELSRKMAMDNDVASKFLGTTGSVQDTNLSIGKAMDIKGMKALALEMVKSKTR